MALWARASFLILTGLLLSALGLPAGAGELRVATFNAELTRKGPGLLLRDLPSGKDKQVQAVVEVILQARPDVLALQGFDHDLAGHALYEFEGLLEKRGHAMPYLYATLPNAGVPSGLDLDNNGRLGEARDAHGYGRFTGQGGMAVLSRFPLGEVRDFTQMLWTDLPGAMPPREAMTDEVLALHRLSSVAHWDVPILLPGGTQLHVLTYHATTPVFDGEEDRNGRRNHDETAFWGLYLDGALENVLGLPAPDGPVVVAGDANLDPADGEGRRDAINALLTHPRLQDPQPKSTGAQLAANPDHKGDPALDTADWTDPAPGNLRVSYLLPSRDLSVLASGVIWPAPGTSGYDTVLAASRHRLVWVDLGW